MSDNTVTDMDLESYIDNQLDNRTRMRVESFLAIIRQLLRGLCRTSPFAAH